VGGMLILFAGVLFSTTCEHLPVIQNILKQCLRYSGMVTCR